MKAARASRRDAKKASSSLGIRKTFSSCTANEVAAPSVPLQPNLPAKEAITAATPASARHSAWQGHYEMQCMLYKHRGILWTDREPFESNQTNLTRVTYWGGNWVTELRCLPGANQYSNWDEYCVSWISIWCSFTTLFLHSGDRLGIWSLFIQLSFVGMRIRRKTIVLEILMRIYFYSLFHLPGLWAEIVSGRASGNLPYIWPRLKTRYIYIYISVVFSLLALPALRIF